MQKEIYFLVLDITLKGGIERFVANMAKMLNAKGFKVTIYSIHKSNSRPLYEIPCEVEIFYLTSFNFRSVFYKITTIIGLIRLALLSSSFGKSFYLISTQPITTIFISWFIPNLMRNIIASEHSTYQSHGWLISKLRLLCYKKVRCIITQTKDGIEQFHQAGLRAVQIPNSCTDFSDPRQWNNFPRPSPRRFICLSVGRFEGVKQLDHYIEMAKIVHQKCPDILFELVGSGPLESQLLGCIKKSGLDNVFKIHPPTPSVNDFYCKSHVYVITSASEAFPMTMLEALSFGLPVLSYDKLVGPKEIIQDGFNGYLCSQNNPEALAAKVVAIYQSPSSLQTLSIGAVESSLDFHENKIAQKWLEVLN